MLALRDVLRGADGAMRTPRIIIKRLATLVDDLDAAVIHQQAMVNRVRRMAGD